ncbi:hypothetical protein J4436_01785 [Candidatus Woesearchaeota archaeon]|nr:hypothetical protein [Candidatus Woesearchaeota archaeon]
MVEKYYRFFKWICAVSSAYSVYFTDISDTTRAAKSNSDLLLILQNNNRFNLLESKLKIEDYKLANGN